MRCVILLFAAAMWSGCAATQSPVMAWDFEAEMGTGEVRALPVLNLVTAPEPRYDTYIDGQIPAWRAILRRERAAEVGAVPAAVAHKLPGAINAELQDGWGGRFRAGHYPIGTKERLADALRQHKNPEDTLRDIGRRSAGTATLITWVDTLWSEPITTLGFPGDLILTASGPVVVDLLQEHHKVGATVGVALVTDSGEVVMRLSRDVEALVSSRIDANDAARKMAKVLAADMVLVWPTEEQYDMEFASLPTH